MSDEAAARRGLGRRGRCAAEFPELRVLSCEVAAPGRRRPTGRRRAAALLASRLRGAPRGRAAPRARPAAYRVFFRHIGLDPDATRTPVEEAALDAAAGGRPPLPRAAGDALLLALLETGVPVSAFDAAARQRAARACARARRASGWATASARRAAAGQLVLADAQRPLAELFGDARARDGMPGRARARLRLVAVRSPGVPAIHVEEALWTCQEALARRLAE